MKCGTVVRIVWQEWTVNDMRLIERKDCPMRHENGNCTAAGGFCTAVNDSICEALHNAFNCGEDSKTEWAILTLAEQSRVYEEKSLAVLRKIHEKVTASPTIDAVPVVRCKDCKHFVHQENGYFCTVFSGYCYDVRFEDDFCYYGERKDGEG